MEQNPRISGISLFKYVLCVLTRRQSYVFASACIRQSLILSSMPKWELSQTRIIRASRTRHLLLLRTSIEDASDIRLRGYVQFKSPLRHARKSSKNVFLQANPDTGLLEFSKHTDDEILKSEILSNSEFCDLNFKYPAWRKINVW